MFNYGYSKNIFYCWRILSFIIISTSFLIAYLSDKKPFVGFILLLAIIFSYFPYTNAVIYQPRQDQQYVTNPNWVYGTATMGNTFNTVWMKRNSIKKDEIFFIEGNGTIANVQRKSNFTSADIQVVLDSQIEISRAYYPGWTVYIDNKKTAFFESDGIIRFRVNKGNHSIIVKLEDTPVRKVSKKLSVLGVIATFASVLFFI